MKITSINISTWIEPTKDHPIDDDRALELVAMIAALVKKYGYSVPGDHGPNPKLFIAKS